MKTGIMKTGMTSFCFLWAVSLAAPISAELVPLFDGKTLAKFATDENGDFKTSYTVPDVPPGTYEVTLSSEEYELEEHMFFTVGSKPECNK